MRIRAERRIGGALAAFVTVLALAIPGAAQAVPLVQVMELLPGNDCSGYFNIGLKNGFPNCRVDGSPSIIKFDEDLDVDEVSVNYPTIDGSEFSFSGLGASNSSGTWTYTPNDLGVGEDPAVRFWSAKAGNGFYLFYVTPGGVLNRSLAESVTTGTWVTPSGKELSHITFYDTGDFPPVVDEPATLVLLGLSLLGLGVARRRRSVAR